LSFAWRLTSESNLGRCVRLRMDGAVGFARQQNARRHVNGSNLLLDSCKDAALSTHHAGVKFAAAVRSISRRKSSSTAGIWKKTLNATQDETQIPIFEKKRSCPGPPS